MIQTDQKKCAAAWDRVEWAGPAERWPYPLTPECMARLTAAGEPKGGMVPFFGIAPAGEGAWLVCEMIGQPPIEGANVEVIVGVDIDDLADGVEVRFGWAPREALDDIPDFDGW